jgi:hypothetical protein
MSDYQAESAAENSTNTSGIESGTPPSINRERPWPPLPPLFTRQIISSPALRLGTLEDIAGAQVADEFFNRPDPFKEARKSALAEIGKYAIF